MKFLKLTTYHYQQEDEVTIVGLDIIGTKRMVEFLEGSKKRVLNLERAYEMIPYEQPIKLIADDITSWSQAADRAEKIKLTQIIFDNEKVLVKETIEELIGEIE